MIPTTQILASALVSDVKSIMESMKGNIKKMSGTASVEESSPTVIIMSAIGKRVCVTVGEDTFTATSTKIHLAYKIRMKKT